MNRPGSPEYAVKLLGKVTASQYQSIGYFFENGHLSRLANSVWPSNLRASAVYKEEKEPQKVIKELSPILEELALSRMFKKDSISTFQHLPLPYNEAWAMFVNSVTQTIGRSSLLQTGEIPPEAQIVTQNEIRRALTHCEDFSSNKLHIFTREFAVLHKGQPIPYGIPDDLVMKANVIGGVDVLQYVDYYPSQPISPISRSQSLRNSLTVKESRRILRRVLGDILQIDPGMVDIPTTTTPRHESWRKVEVGKNPLPTLKMVIGSTTCNNKAESTGYDGEPINMGLPNMELLSLWLLRILAGNVPQETDWRRYFTEVSN